MSQKNTPTTMNNVVDYLRRIAKNHSKLKDFGFGEGPNDKHNMKMPYMWVEPTSSNITRNVNGVGILNIVYQFDIHIMDRVDMGDANYQDTLNSTNTILQEIMVNIEFNKKLVNKLMVLDFNTAVNAAKEVNDHNVNGWTASIGFVCPILINPCQLPIDEDCDCGCP